jgi:hypothetical protein
LTHTFIGVFGFETVGAYAPGEYALGIGACHPGGEVKPGGGGAAGRGAATDDGGGAIRNARHFGHLMAVSAATPPQFPHDFTGKGSA